MTLKLPAAVPEIPVTDLERAIAYYRDALGFDLDWREAELGLAGLSSGDCRLFLASRQYRQARGTGGPILFWLNLESKEQVNALYSKWRNTAARLQSAPESKEYGLHEFTVRDLDENQLRVFYDFATPQRESRDAA